MVKFGDPEITLWESVIFPIKFLDKNNHLGSKPQTSNISEFRIFYHNPWLMGSLNCGWQEIGI